MYDTLAYIPTILAYIFVLLLLVILGFVVIYIAHKIYGVLYDYMPVAQLSSKMLSTHQYESVFRPEISSDLLTLDRKTDLKLGCKSNTALRIIVNLEPCYLAYVAFESALLCQPGNLPTLYKMSRNPDKTSSTSNGVRDSRTSEVAGSDCYLIKYFDNLTLIPCTTDLQENENLKYNNVYKMKQY